MRTIRRRESATANDAIRISGKYQMSVSTGGVRFRNRPSRMMLPPVAESIATTIMPSKSYRLRIPTSAPDSAQLNVAR